MFTQNITVLSEDEADVYTCSCGNHSNIAGFYPCTIKGVIVEPIKNWDGFYVCKQCGEITYVLNEGRLTPYDPDEAWKGGSSHE